MENIMNNLMMNDREFLEYQRMYSEACRLIGQPATLYVNKNYDTDLYHDKFVEHEGGRAIGIIFEQSPMPILKQFNWMSEEDEIPYVVYMVPLDSFETPFVVEEQMIVALESTRNIQSTKLFRVNKVKGSSIDPLMFICNLAPYRAPVDFQPEVPGLQESYRPRSDMENSYLKQVFNK